MEQPPWERVVVFYETNHTHLSYDPQSHAYVFTQEITAYAHTKTFTQILIAALFIKKQNPGKSSKSNVVYSYCELLFSNKK